MSHGVRRSLLIAALLVVAASPLVLDAPVAGADTLAQSSTYFYVRPDPRLCPSPVCGGVFVSRVNLALTPCPDGTRRAACHASEVDWTPLGLDPDTLAKLQAAVLSGHGLVRGRLRPGESFPGHGPLGRLVVTEGWIAATEAAPGGTVFRVRELGIVCVTTPCFHLHESKLNTIRHRDISGLDLSGVGADDNHLRAAEEALSTTSLLVAGRNRREPDVGPARAGVELVATQFYLRVDSPR